MLQNGLANYLKPVKSVYFKNYKLVVKYHMFFVSMLDKKVTWEQHFFQELI